MTIYIECGANDLGEPKDIKKTVKEMVAVRKALESRHDIFFTMPLHFRDGCDKVNTRIINNAIKRGLV